MHRSEAAPRCGVADISTDSDVTWHNRSVVNDVVALSALPAQVGPAVGDTSSSRIVYGIVIGLLLIGVLLVVLAVWLIRQTRVDPELLGPLERMSESRWRKGDVQTRRALLDDVRPPGAPTPNWQDPQDPPVATDLPAPVPPDPVPPDPVEPDPVEPDPVPPGPAPANLDLRDPPKA